MSIYVILDGYSEEAEFLTFSSLTCQLHGIFQPMETRFRHLANESRVLLPRGEKEKEKRSFAASRVTSVDKVQELLECLVCMNLMSPPIYQCPNGHTVCSPCKARVHNSCPTCRYQLGDIRCLALEKVAETIELPCEFQNSACSDVFLHRNKLKHEKVLTNRPYHCPYAGVECPVTGDIPSLLLHLRSDHKVSMHDGCTFNHKYVNSNAQEVDHATWMLSFCLHFEAFHLRQAPVYMAFLQFMGEEEEAKRFSYTLEVGGNGRRLTWQGVPRSIRDSHKNVRDSQDGLIIPRNQAISFSGGNRPELQLKVSGRVWREK